MVQHCDEEVIALIALGETVDASDDAHVQQCPRCQSRVDQLAAVVATTRSLTDNDRPVVPPASVWSGVTNELGLAGPPSNVVSLDRARSRRRTWVFAAAAAVVGIALGSVVTVGVQESGTQADLVAQASLDSIEDSGYQGTASVETVDGQAVLVVSVPDLPVLSDEYYEVWMATPDTATMVAIGTLNPGQEGRFVLPAGMDTTSFPVVDVSVEAFDGDAGHSAKSVVRGQLAT
jgi:hypothetical protein